MSNTTRTSRSAVALLATAGLALGVMTSSPAAAATQVTATQGVNIRSGPSTADPVVGGLYRGQTVTAVSATAGWTKITYLGEAAYVSSAFLSEGSTLPASSQVDASVVKVTTANVNLRTGPGLSYAIIRVLNAGSQVTLTGKTSMGFAEVIFGSSRGWVSTQYLASSSTGLPPIVGVRVATADLAIRTTSGADSVTVATVTKGTSLSITGTTQNDRAQIIYGNAIRWVTARYLSNPANPGPIVPTLPPITGTRYATVTLNIRSNATDTYTLIATVPPGTKLSITGVVTNGRAQIIYGSAVRWVTAQYLSTTAPTAPPPPNDGVEKGLTPNTIAVHRAAMKAFPQITTYYGYRNDPSSDHYQGRALDLMIPGYTTAAGKALGYEVAAWAVANIATLKIDYIIWDQRIYSQARASEGWRAMANRGSDSANHKDHVHISVRP